MNPNKDYFFSEEQLKVEVQKYISDIPSTRLTKLAAGMGYTPKAFINAQMRLRGERNINELIKSGDIKPIEAPQNFDGVNSGFKYLIKEGGLPLKGSAYLASTIQSLKGWDFNLEDKGQLSCAPWMDTPVRLAALEKHYGKKVNQITCREQLSYMIQEMKTSFPDSYRIFMDPNATKSALTKATYMYFGSGFDPKNMDSINKDVKNLLSTIPD